MKVYPLVRYVDTSYLVQSFIPREPSDKFLNAYKNLIVTFRRGKMKKEKFNELMGELMVKNGQFYSREEWSEVGLDETFKYFNEWFKFAKPKKAKGFIELDTDELFATRYLKDQWNYQL